jgi:hypothetical protein
MENVHLYPLLECLENKSNDIDLARVRSSLLVFHLDDMNRTPQQHGVRNYWAIIL